MINGNEDKFRELEQMNPMGYSLSDLLRVAGQDPLVHRLISMAYRAGERDASAQALGAIESAIRLSGFGVSDAQLIGLGE